MKPIIILVCSLVMCTQVKSQDADSKAVYLKMIEEVIKIGKGIWRLDTVLIADSTNNWHAKENYLLISIINKAQKNKNGEWQSLLKNYDFDQHPVAITQFFEVQDIPKMKGTTFMYMSQRPAHMDVTPYWRFYFSPLYFNADKTKCIAVADFLAGWCGTGAKRIRTFKKDKNGAWVNATPSFNDN